GVRPDAEEFLPFGRGDVGRGDERQSAGRNRAIDHGHQAFARFAALAGARRIADFEHFGGGDTFRIGKVGVHHHGAAQGDREQHAQDAARGADPERGPEREVRPPADDQQTRQHEDDGGKRAGGGRHRLYDVVLEDGGVLEGRQDGHRDDGRGDRGG